MNEIQKKLLLDRLFEPQNLPALKKILKVGFQKRVDPACFDITYSFQIRISKREIEDFKDCAIDRERYLLDRYLLDLTHYVGDI